LDTASSFGSRPKVESSIDGEIVVILTEDAYKLSASFTKRNNAKIMMMYYMRRILFVHIERIDHGSGFWNRGLNVFSW
jgi:hypothetical protein